MLTSLCSRPECWQGGLFRNRICGWYWRSRPPIRINDISSWSYDIDTMDFMNTVNWNDFEIFFHWHSSCQRVVHVENDFSAKEACHLDNIGVVFWKVQPKARLGIFLPSYEAFLVWCYTGCHILVTSCTEMEVHLMDANTPLNVELRTFIESHFKCIFMNVKLIFRIGFSVNLQNLPGPPWGHPHVAGGVLLLQRRNYATKLNFLWMYRSEWLERNIKDAILCKGSLSETILVRKYNISSLLSY